MIGVLGVILLIIIIGAVFVNTSPQFGGKPSKESLVKIENSPNYNGDGAFKNQEITLQMTGFKWITIPKFFTNGNNKVPKNELPSEKLMKSY
ncbi:MAG: hypothetical protein AB1Z17_05295, partial [Lutibacter sp.]